MSDGDSSEDAEELPDVAAEMGEVAEDAQDVPDTPAEMLGESTSQVPGSTLEKGDTGDDVEQLVAYLTQFGYFPNTSLREGDGSFRSVEPFAPEDASKFDDTVESAVTAFQQQQGLEVTGTLNEETLDLMKQPRCGCADQPVVGADGVAEFVAHGNRWPGNNVTYRFDNYTGDLSQAAQRAAVQGAFARWAAVTPLNFAETAGAAQMRISWATGNHGDGSSFDGPSGVLAHCFYPPPNSGDLAGDCHFDDAETWSVNTPPSGIDLATVALHEIGHGLGLKHSADSTSVMYAYYGGPRRELLPDDINGIQSIYGKRFRWGSLGGHIFDPQVASNNDGRLEVFARGTDGALWHKWQTAPNNGWSGWASLGGVINGPIAVGANADGRLEVFARGTDGALWHKWQTGGGWSGWASLGGRIWNPVVGKNKDGRLEVFVTGADNACWHIWQTAPNGNWSGWASRGGGMGSAVAVGTNADGRLELFVRGTNGALYHQWQTAPNNGWSGWASRGGQIQGAPSVGRNKDGRVEVFAKGMDNAQWHIWQTAPNNGWSGWASLGGIITSPTAVTNNADGRLELFTRGTDGALWHMWQTAPSNGWSIWATLGGQIQGGPIAGRNKDGRLEVFAKGMDHALWHTWQSAPNNGWN